MPASINCFRRFTRALRALRMWVLVVPRPGGMFGLGGCLTSFLGGGEAEESDDELDEEEEVLESESESESDDDEEDVSEIKVLVLMIFRLVRLVSSSSSLEVLSSLEDSSSSLADDEEDDESSSLEIPTFSLETVSSSSLELSSSAVLRPFSSSMSICRFFPSTSFSTSSPSRFRFLNLTPSFLKTILPSQPSPTTK